MSQRFRTSEFGHVDRETPVTFSFDGQRLDGFAGDTLASALLANGIHLVGRSFKYHRPRGILSAGSEEPNALVTVGEDGRATPNLRATQVELYEGLAATSQNRWPNLSFDAHAIFNSASRLLPAGFYYKTFMWPASLWTTYEHFIRRAAGMGNAPAAADPDRYEKTHRHCDVLVVGAGPAGLAAALAAARTGARVVLADEGAAFGGDILSTDENINGAGARAWADTCIEELASLPEVTLLPRTTVFGYYDHNHLTALERVTDHLASAPANVPRQRLWTFRAKEVVLATGSIERAMVFRDNDRPGTMLCGAANTYLNRYGVKVGKRTVVYTGNDSAYQSAISLSEAGIEVSILDTRAETPGPLPQKALEKGIEVLHEQAIVATRGRLRIESIEVMSLSDDANSVSGAAQRIECDSLLMSGGWSPTVHLFSQSQGKLRYDNRIGAFCPGTSVQRQRSVGSCNGAFDLASCLHEGWQAGIDAAADAGLSGTKSGEAPQAEPTETGDPRFVWLIPTSDPIGQGGKHFVDFQNDSTAADIQLAAREGFESIEHMKRYTTTGMGTDQGKVGNINGLAILSKAVEKEITDVGVTTFRPPYTPVTFGAMAGRDVGPIMADPLRKTPMDAWHERAGATFELVSQWRRPFYYPKSGEGKWDAVNREIAAVRNTVGILDATTLGKIDIQGPDAVKLLNWVYTNNWDSLKVGHCRYGLMCGEDGMVFDDGVTARLGENHYLMHTTTGNAAHVLAWLEEWLQTEWSEMQVFCASVTEQFATINLAGPHARSVLAALTNMDVSCDAFPFMTLREGVVADTPARVFRVSFTGELSYEINVPASYGVNVWNACITAGEKYGLVPFGTEALHVLRAEKGYIAVGQDTDGTVTPADLGMGRMVSKKKDFLGKRSLSRADMTVPERRQFVGLLTTDPTEVLPEGAHIVEQVFPKPPMKTLGHVTSSYYSPTLERSIALGMLEAGHAKMGETVHLPLEDGRVVTVTVTSPVFFDPKGKRLHA
ncbi:MAG: sarcosine oxidase subunit alpha family protein [Pseudomonadota bacterium]|nr:sarcosine oxidase subunit alpha family protein [Pseudomonadota bacterium]